MKIVTVVGARPQFIKAAMVSAALAERGRVQEIVLHTGQHYDENMSGVFFSELGLPAPKRQLQVGSGPHGAQTGEMLTGIERALLEERPDWVLVYGDTNSTLAGALAATKLSIPVAHVEAGMRSFNRRMPEEINRVLTDHVSDLLLAVTATARDNLVREGLDGRHIEITGDVMYDAALAFGGRLGGSILSQLGLVEGGYALATVHRAENTDDEQRLRVILDALADLSRRMKVVFPLHPRTRQAITRAGLAFPPPDIGGLLVLPPQGYLAMLELERHACLVVSDSGGVQKEAYFFRIPCVTLREETEWVELVDLGWNRLAAPTTRASVARAIDAALADPLPPAGEDPFGGGQAAVRIASLLEVGEHCAS